MSGQSLTIDPNGPATATSYAVPADARLLRPGGGTLADLKQGDKVIVVLQNSKPVVVIASMQVTIWPQMGPRPPMARGHGEMKPRQEMPRGHSQHMNDDSAGAGPVWSGSGGVEV